MVPIYMYIQDESRGFLQEAVSLLFISYTGRVMGRQIFLEPSHPNDKLKQSIDT